MIQGMYPNAQSLLPVGQGYSQEFEVKVEIHQGFILSPLLFIIVLEPLSCKLPSGVPLEDLYADHLVIIVGSLEECVRRLVICNVLRVNAGKSKVMNSGEYPCAVCHKGVANKSIYFICPD